MGIIDRTLKKPFFGRFQRPWLWPDGVPLDRWERITFPNRRGATLAGVFGAADVSPAMGAVVLAHPLSVAAKGFWLKHGHAELLRRAGFAVLAFDFNGFGESDSLDFDYPADVIAAGAYLRARASNLPLAVVGASFGAGWALCAMANESHPFRAAVLEAAFPSLPFYWRRYPLAYAILRTSQLLYPRLEQTLRPSRAATQLKHSPHILLIYGDADSLTPLQVGVELQAAMSTCTVVETWTVPEADHNLALQTASEAYAHHVTSFLLRTLGRSE
ncbi:MAG TPA: alpha/beta fold hydrolase [Vicinamibacterales bacterium]|nr:alpha/beta fold hydrolase [Vicinamibacterales bacterium]